MKCPFCIEEGKKSRLMIGTTESTLVHSTPFYDEDGNYHHHDKNTVTRRYSCSEGHKFKIVTTNGCIATNCEFKKEEEIVKL